jgi:hypothetical protein
LTSDVAVRELFLGFYPPSDTTGEGLCNYLLSEFLTDCELDIQDMRGQGYDNGANMRGKHNGLQNKIRNINPGAFFIPCASHSLNLVVKDAAKVTFETLNFFNKVQELYTFFFCIPLQMGYTKS